MKEKKEITMFLLPRHSKPYKVLLREAKKTGTRWSVVTTKGHRRFFGFDELFATFEEMKAKATAVANSKLSNAKLALTYAEESVVTIEALDEVSVGVDKWSRYAI